MSEVLQIQGLAFSVRRCQQRKTLELIIGRSGDLTVRAPENTSITDLERWTKTKLLWVHTKLALKGLMQQEWHLALRLESPTASCSID